MKKILGILFVVALVLVSFGCASKPKEVLGAEGIPRPQWVADMALEDPVLHYEIGFGKGTNRASSMARAESDARNKIAFWVKTDVETVLKTYMQDAGVADETQMIEYIEQVSIQTANTTISGAEIKGKWEDIEGGIYVLMGYDINKAAENLAKQMDSVSKPFIRNDSAAFADFKAQEAFKALEESKRQKAAANAE